MAGFLIFVLGNLSSNTDLVYSFYSEGISRVKHYQFVVRHVGLHQKKKSGKKLIRQVLNQMILKYTVFSFQ